MQKLITKRTTTKQQTNDKQKPTAQSNPKLNNKKHPTTTHKVRRQTRSKNCKKSNGQKVKLIAIFFLTCANLYHDHL